MNIKIVLGAIVIIASLSIFVSASMVIQSDGNYINSVYLEKGWNIIPGTLPDSGITSDSQIQTGDISAMWYYWPLNNEYIRVYPNPDLDKLQQADDDVVLTSAMWIYSKKAGNIKYSTLEDYPSLQNRQLSSGWNFVSVTPDMFENNEDFSWNSIKGSCSINKVFAWIHEEQDWLSIEPSQESFDFNDFIGFGMIVKVNNDCKLEAPTSDIIPPIIPNDVALETPEEVEEDIGEKLIYIKTDEGLEVDCGNLGLAQGTCDYQMASYKGSAGEDADKKFDAVGLYAYVITYEDMTKEVFFNALIDLYGNSPSDESFSNNDYYKYAEGTPEERAAEPGEADEGIFWTSGDNFILLHHNGLDGDTTDGQKSKMYFDALLEEYTNKYPSSL